MFFVYPAMNISTKLPITGSHADQTNQRPLGALIKPSNKLLIFLISLPAVPCPHTPRLEFPVDGPVQTPTLLRKSYFEDEQERQNQRKLQNRNACHDSAFWQNL